MLAATVRVGLLLDLVHSTLHIHVTQVRNFERYLSKTTNWYYFTQKQLDASAVLRILSKAPDCFANNESSARILADDASRLIEIRNRWAHQRLIRQSDANKAAVIAARILHLTGFKQEADAAKQLGPAGDPSEIGHLRTLLISRAVMASPTLTYAKAITAMGWDDSRTSMNRLIRALNGLGGWQRAAGEPVLSALVVLSDKDAEEAREAGLPGRGFYWLVNLPPNAAFADKRKAHKAALDRIRRHQWDLQTGS